MRSLAALGMTIRFVKIEISPHLTYVLNFKTPFGSSKYTFNLMSAYFDERGSFKNCRTCEARRNLQPPTHDASSFRSARGGEEPPRRHPGARYFTKSNTEVFCCPKSYIRLLIHIPHSRITKCFCIHLTDLRKQIRLQ